MEIENIEEFVVIDKRIDAAEEEAGALLGETIRDRWEFGRLMLAARGLTKAGKPSKQLPNGYLDKLVEETGKSQRELGYRMQFAEQYPTDDEVCRALQTLESWTQIVGKGLRKPRSESDKSKASPPARNKKATEIINLANQGLTRQQIIEKTGASSNTVRTELEYEAIIETAAPIAWESIPGNQQVKLERAKKGIRRELEKELRAQLQVEADQFRAECAANVAEHKAKVDARAKLERENRDRERARYDMLSKVHSGKGLITPNEYKLIRSCLHPDRLGTDGEQENVSIEKLATAFRLFNSPQVRALLVKEV